MKKPTVTILIIVAVLIAIFCWVFFSANVQQKRDEEERAKQLKIIGNIQFKGNVINSIVFKSGGRSYYAVCVKLDYSNVHNFYVYNNIVCLKIKNGYATFAAGGLDSNIGVATYVEINIDNSKIEKFRYKNGDTSEYDLGLPPSHLSESSLNFCNK